MPSKYLYYTIFDWIRKYCSVVPAKEGKTLRSVPKIVYFRCFSAISSVCSYSFMHMLHIWLVVIDASIDPTIIEFLATMQQPNNNKIRQQAENRSTCLKTRPYHSFWWVEVLVVVPLRNIASPQSRTSLDSTSLSADFGFRKARQGCGGGQS